MKQLIKDAVNKAIAGEHLNYEFYQSSSEDTGNNTFLFFIKPELTLPNAGVNFDSVLDLILQRIKDYDLSIENMRVLSAKYLHEYSIMAQHYGVINKISANAKENMSDEAKKKFKELYGQEADIPNLLGSIEFLEHFSVFSPTSLDYLWQNADVHKLAGGTYVARVLLDSKEYFIVDAFHPRQLEHFIQPGRCIVSFTLTSDTDWKDARQKFIGATNPAQASEGSIRNELLKKKEDLGLTAITSSWNGVHLSAGPVEALVELVRYNSNFASGKKIDISEYKFGGQLKENFSEKQIHSILANANVEFEGKTTPVFDLTEEKNSDEALEILKKVYK
jgi:nucleoside diphosphate kinase